MLTGQILEVNGVPNLSCYPDNLPIGTVACEGGANNARFQALEWATPVTTNGLTVSGFQYDRATNSTPPDDDAFKVLLVSEGANLGSYKRVVIPNAWTLEEIVEACCAGCDPIPDVVVPQPLFDGLLRCIAPAITCPPCVQTIIAYVPALTGTNDTYTATPTGTDAAGAAITFSPTSVTGASLTALAAAAETAWATELGTGTFVVSGTTLTVTGTDIGSLSLNIVQSDAP